MKPGSDRAISIAGAGPAGTSAAIAACGLGAAVTLFDPSALPRHKVCGEFLSPEVEPLLRELGVWDRVIGAGAVRYDRLTLHFPKRTRTAVFHERPLGLSRHALDRILLDEALARGAQWVRSRIANACVIAHGRQSAAARGNRLFGFKAHFTGPASSGVDLFFLNGCYAGVSQVENGATNVCGLVSEPVLKRYGFSPLDLLCSFEPLRERLLPLTPSMRWLMTGPLVFGGSGAAPEAYLAGDAISFLDPFTGSGLLSAMWTGQSAGRAAALGEPVELHTRRCRSMLRVQLAVSSVFRFLIRTGAAEILSGLVPGELLVAATRPHVRGLASG